MRVDEKMSQAAANSERFIVRAELRADDETVISYGFDLTASSVFVVTEWNAPNL